MQSPLKSQASNLPSLRTALSSLSPENIELFCSAAVPVTVNKGEPLVKAGSLCRSIWFIEQGYFRTVYLHNGEEVNTAFYMEHQFVTDIKSLRQEQPAESAIVAGEDALVFQFTKTAMIDLYAQSAAIVEFGKKLIETLLIAEQEYGNLFRLYPAEERYQHLLSNKPELLQRVPLSQLASYLGMARETLSRMRGKVK